MFLQDQENSLIFKIILLGDPNVGKTLLIHKYIYGACELTKVTTNVDLFCKTLKIDSPLGRQQIILQIWDTSGQQRYKSIAPSFFKGAAAVLLFYDVNQRKSFQNLTQWLSDFHQVGSKETLVVLVGTKCDLEAKVQAQQSLKFTQTVKGEFAIQTSAKNNINVDELFLITAKAMSKKYKQSKQFRNLVKPQRKKSFISGQNLDEKKKCC